MTKEKFICPECGFVVEVEWSEELTQREVPCGRCYYETFALNEETRETEKFSHGHIIQCEKGKGV